MCHTKQHRARAHSADIGGLFLATSDREETTGRGWMGADGPGIDPSYAQNLTEMYTQSVYATSPSSPGTPQCAPKFNTTSLFAPITADEPYPDSPSFYASLPESTRIHLIGLLDNWSFEPYLLPAELLVPCALLLFESLFCMEGMDDVIGLKLNEGSSSRDGVNFARDIVPFVYQLRGIYRTEPRYHNYEHALDVLQGCYMILKTAGMVPSVRVLLEESPARWEPTRPYDASEGPLVDCLDVQDIFAIYITAIGHDVGHPGFTNAFMQLTNSPLTLIYPSSSLERMHHSLLMRTMRQQVGFRNLLDDPEHGTIVRNLINYSVMATDMGVHDAFVTRFSGVLEGKAKLMERRILVCQGIIKCADISNPTRPFNISRRWCRALMKEWKAQANLESILKPGVTTSTSSAEKPPPPPPSVAEANSQIFFIDKYVRPLFELVSRGIPGMESVLDECSRNLAIWTDVLASGIAPMGDAVTDDEMDSFSTVLPFTLAKEHREAILFHHLSSSSSSSTSESSRPSTPVSSISPVSIFNTGLFSAGGDVNIDRAARVATLKSGRAGKNRSSWSAPLSLEHLVDGL